MSKMKKSMLICLGMALLGSFRLCFAEPLVMLPRGDFSCTVEVSSHYIPKPNPTHPEWRYTPVIKRIVITCVGNIRRDEMIWSDGSISQLWDLADKKIAIAENGQDSKKPVYVLTGLLRDQACPKLLHFDADSVSWITKGSLLTKEGETLHYRATVKPPDSGVQIGDDPSRPSLMAVYEAWIDLKTLQPLKLDDGEALYTLSFSKKLPKDPLVIPPRLQAELNRWLAAFAPHPHL